MKAKGTNPATGAVEPCTVLEGYYGWQDAVKFDSHVGASGQGKLHGANEVPDLEFIESEKCE